MLVFCFQKYFTLLPIDFVGYLLRYCSVPYLYYIFFYIFILNLWEILDSIIGLFTLLNTIWIITDYYTENLGTGITAVVPVLIYLNLIK